MSFWFSDYWECQPTTQHTHSTIRIQHIAHSRTWIIFSSIWLVDGRSEQESSSTPSWPSLNFFTHLAHTCTYDKVDSPQACSSNSWVSTAILSSFVQNLIAKRCSKVFFNVRRDGVSKQWCTKSVTLTRPMLGTKYRLTTDVCRLVQGCTVKVRVPHTYFNSSEVPNMSRPLEAWQKIYFMTFGTQSVYNN